MSIDLVHITTLFIYPLRQMSSLHFQFKLFRNYIALNSNPRVEICVLLMAVKALVKYYNKKMYSIHFDIFAFIAFAEFQDSKIFAMEKFTTFCCPMIFISGKVEWL